MTKYGIYRDMRFHWIFCSFETVPSTLLFFFYHGFLFSFKSAAHHETLKQLMSLNVP